ncbi:hypothetical protein NESM_000444700 [Novymonas esmeraldas]|uniref:Uncharacterized protein n=1 Tax=Novymonas esmeraldas TaxID=1808958 RepID=A0AAW0EQW1_9TRYP
MQSTRSPVKVSAARLPYSAATRERRQAASLLSRLARGVGAAVVKATQPPLPSSPSSSSSAAVAAVAAAALTAGDVLRDIAFFTQPSEVNFFSAHPSLCAQVFGFTPGEVLERSGGRDRPDELHDAAEEVAEVDSDVVVVVGARGGKLWVWAWGDAAARVWQHPPPPADHAAVGADASVGASGVRAAMLAHCPHRPLCHPVEGLRGGGGGAAEKRVHAALAAFHSLCDRAREEAQRLYTADQRAFLQCAPDLYVAAVGKSQQQQQQDSVSSSDSLYFDIASNTAAAVLLAPCVVVVASGAVVGWVGEGNIVLTGALVGGDGGVASLSASVVF